MSVVTAESTSLNRTLKAMTPDEYRGFIADALTDMTHIAEREIKERTPVVTGHLRRSEISDVSHVRDDSDPYGRAAVTAVEYAPYIEEGVWPGGTKRLRTKPDGYRMFQDGGKAAEEKAPRLLEKLAKQVVDKWAAS